MLCIACRTDVTYMYRRLPNGYLWMRLCDCLADSQIYIVWKYLGEIGTRGKWKCCNIKEGRAKRGAQTRGLITSNPSEKLGAK